MELYYYLSRLLFISVFLLLIFSYSAIPQKSNFQDDTILAPDAVITPVLDGKSDDKCWQNVPWQSIGQVWIPYGASVDSGDYSGRYKVVWSSVTNLLYFLIEINDDVFVGGYVPGVTADIYNFDITEVFIDEDMSGGLHVFDGTGDTAREWGTNAENAFTYHIYAAYPDEGKVTMEHYVGDLGGTSWSNVKNLNYAAHLPDLALRKTGNTAVWEFSLIVYNDGYEDTLTNKDAARVKLEAGKVMGLSVAYCDNDNSDGVRDNMFGSVWEPDPGNLHWQNSDYFGKVQLVFDNPASNCGENIHK